MANRKIKKSNSQKKTKFTMPKWMDCAWRRERCQQKDCPICSRIEKDRERHLKRGEDPDTLEAALADVGTQFKEILSTIKADAARHGFKISNIDNVKEPPEPHKFPLYNKVFDWRQDIYNTAYESDEVSSSWLYTEAAEDLLWYANTLIAKTYRQLCNRWHIKEGDEYGQEDFDYTRYVLKECFSILKHSLAELTKMDITQKGKFTIALVMLNSLEREILKI